MGFWPWRASLLIVYWLILERCFGGVSLNFDECCTVNFSNMNWRFFPIRKAVAESIRKKWSMFPESAFVLSEMEKIEVVKLLFNSHHGILWLLSISKKYFSVLRERHSLHATSLTNLGLINNCWGRTKEERCLSLRAKYKGRG